MKCYVEILKISLVFLVVFGCKIHDQEGERLKLFSEYYEAISQQDAAEKWKYTTDTVKVWFDSKEGEAILQIKGVESAGRWSEWDQEMQSESYYDSIWFDPSENAIKGYFFENNLFYNLIGKPATKTLRTYWLNHENKIHEILIYWIPEENSESAEHLGPIVEWAMKNDSVEISELYPDGQIIPGKQNAIRWKTLLKKYQDYLEENQ